MDTGITAGTLSLSNYTDSGSSTTDKISNDNTFDLTISGNESGSTVAYEVSTDGGTTWVATTANQSGLTDGTYSFRATVTDIAGNSATTPVQTIKIDTTVSNPTLALATDSGSSNSDGITNVATINVSNLESGATWEYSVDGGSWTAGTGTSFNASSGSHTYSVRQTDTAGNTSTGSSAVTYNLDTVLQTSTVSPSEISLGAYGKFILPYQVASKWYYYWDRSGDGEVGPTDGISMNSLESTYFGSSTNQVITDSNRTFTINGLQVKMISQSELINLRNTYGAAWSIDIETSTISATYSDDHMAILMQNGSTPYSTSDNVNHKIAVQVDQSSDGLVFLLNYNDIGAYTQDNRSNDNTFDLTITGNEAGSTVVYEVSTNGGTTWTTTTANQSSLTDGTYLYRAVVTDVAGNTGTTVAQTVRVDTLAPTCTITDNIGITTATGVITYTFQFSEGVTGFDASDIVITNTEISSPTNENTRYTTGIFTKVDNDTYTYTITPDGGTGTLGVNVTTGSFSDLASNANSVNTTADNQRYSVIDLGAGNGKLTNGVQIEGNWYYYWDKNGDGSANVGDGMTMDAFELAYFGSNAGTVVTDTNRSFTLDGVSLKLPTYGGGSEGTYKNGTAWSSATSGYDTNSSSNLTYDELTAIWDAYNGTSTGTNIIGTPTGWYTSSSYVSATSVALGGHNGLELSSGYTGNYFDANTFYYAFQVI